MEKTRQTTYTLSSILAFSALLSSQTRKDNRTLCVINLSLFFCHSLTPSFNNSVGQGQGPGLEKTGGQTSPSLTPVPDPIPHACIIGWTDPTLPLCPACACCPQLVLPSPLPFTWGRETGWDRQAGGPCLPVPSLQLTFSPFPGLGRHAYSLRIQSRRQVGRWGGWRDLVVIVWSLFLSLLCQSLMALYLLLYLSPSLFSFFYPTEPLLFSCICAGWHSPSRHGTCYSCSMPLPICL